MRYPDRTCLNTALFNDWVLAIIDDYVPRYEVYYGGGGSGKSYGAVQKIVLKALGNRRIVLIIRKVDRTLKDSIYKLFKTVLQSGGLQFYENKSEMRLILSNGSEFIFKGLDDPEKIKSIADITDIVIEEATELTQDDFTQLDIRLRPPAEVGHPQIYLMFNPVSKANWCYSHWFKNGHPSNSRVIHSTYKDNKFLTAEYKEMLESLVETNPSYYKIYCLGEFATLDKLVFPIIHKRIISLEEVRGLPHWCGLDFGFVNDPSALTWGRIDQKAKNLFITGEFDRKGMTNPEIASTIQALGLGKEIIVADLAEQKSIEEIRRTGIYRIRAAEKGPDSIIYGLDTMQSYRIIVDERCPHTIEEFESYTWQKDKKTGEYINKPVDTNNHHIDSIRYGIQAVLKRTGVHF